MPTPLRRLLGAVEAIALAAIATIIGTVAHQTLISGAYFGLLVGYILVIASGLHVRSKHPRWTAFLYAISLGVFVFWAGDAGNQDKLIPATTLGYLWAYGSIALGLFVALFPRLKRH